MYEKLRREMMMELSSLQIGDSEEVLMALDRVMAYYTITPREMGLSIAQEEIPGLVKMYLVCKKMEGLSDCTLRNYSTTLKVFFRHLRKAPEEVTSNDIRLFLYYYQKNTGVKSGSLNKYREYINRFFCWCHGEGYIPTNPSRNVGTIRYEKKPRVALTQIELEYLRSVCIDPREKAIIEFLYSTGCRVSELSQLKLSDLNWENKSVHLFGKGRKHRTSFLNAKAEISLLHYLETRSDDCEFVFVSQREPIRQLQVPAIQKIIRGITKRSTNEAVRGVTPHILRHTMATAALQGGMPVVEVSRLLGHENLDTTLIYAKSSYSDIQASHRKYVI